MNPVSKFAVLSDVSVALLSGLVLFFVFSPYDSRDRARAEREALTGRSSTPMEIALVWPAENGHAFVKGAALAVQQINDSGGISLIGENGQAVKTRLHIADIYDEYADRDIGRTARRIVNNRNLSAVIGHSDPDGAIRASVTYQDYGLLYLSPDVSDLHLTDHGFWTTVQTIPEDAVISDSIVQFALKRGYQDAGILYVRNSYGETYERLLREGMGKYFASHGAGTNRAAIKLAFEGYYAEDQRSFYLLISQLLHAKFDVLFVADTLIGDSGPRTLELLRQLREMGVNQPIVGTEELHSSAVWYALREKANHMFAPIMVELTSNTPNPAVRRFRNGFVEMFGELPTIHASESYEAVLLLAQAAERAGSKVPIKMSIMFKSTTKWNGLQGEGAYDFSPAGGVLGKHVFVEEMKDGNFITPAVIEGKTVLTNTHNLPRLNRPK